MNAARVFTTSEKNHGFFNLPPENMAKNKFLKKKEIEKSLSDRILEKVFKNTVEESLKNPPKDDDK
ncbi:hypothetical protein [Paenibacillus sp. PL2-23]|uniref:hypothetical protein n=1 Tax=Paenibacillus sp. PL2-23 TaxID=2100729 RepID=UPI0030F581F1